MSLEDKRETNERNVIPAMIYGSETRVLKASMREDKMN